MTDILQAGDIKELFERRKASLEAIKVLEATMAYHKNAIAEGESALRSFLIRSGQQQVVVKGLFSASLSTKTVYKVGPEFKDWALQNDTTCLTISAKQSGIAAYVEEFGALPPATSSTELSEVKISKRS